MTVQAKFKVVAVIEHADYPAKTVKLAAVYDQGIPEDRRFAQATPQADMSMTVDNPAALEELQLGQFFYVDFTRVPKA